MKTFDEVTEWVHRMNRFSPNLGLERFSHLLGLLGRPQDGLRFIHVAGTNGKGSVTAMVASVLRAAGLRTGMYTSPDLEDLRERVMVDGRKIPVPELLCLATAVRKAMEQVTQDGYDTPIQFEVLTAIGLSHFRDSGCQVVSLEVGLGGRYDATNVVTPEVSVIVTVALDHTEILGDTTAKIAREKAGIIKRGVPVVTGVRDAAALEVIRECAGALNSPLTTVGPRGQAVTWTERSSGLDGQVIDVKGPGYRYDALRIPLLGRHQQLNAAVAVAALEEARRRGNITYDESALRAGLERTVWPGRLELIHREPLVLLDGAHNPEGAAALVNALRAIPRERSICVLGVLGDKRYSSIVSLIAPECDEVIATQPASPRALPPSDLAREIAGSIPVSVEPDPARALDIALNRAGPHDLIVCCGSLYLVGPARRHLRERFGIPEYGMAGP